MIKVAILSFWHVHAKDYAGQAIKHPNTEIAALWDENAERGRLKAAEYGVPFYENLQELLVAPEIDGVIVTTPTNRHHEVMIAAARAGKHIFTEKVIAPTTKLCDEILAAVEAAGVKLTVSLPRLNMGFTLALQQLVHDGVLGDLTVMRTRLSHNGALPAENAPNGSLPAHFFNLEESCGGAMIDLGCHPMVLTRLFLGMPESISSSYGYVTGREVEDNAVAVLRYADGAVGIVEAGFSTRNSTFSIELHGTEGSAVYSRHDEKLYVRSTKLEGPAEWRVMEVGSARPSAFEQWVAHIQNGTVASENIELARDLTRLMEASNLSARSGAAYPMSQLAE